MRLISILVISSIALLSAAEAKAQCRGFDSTLVQLNGQDFKLDQQGWGSALDVLDAIGIELIVIQYSGDAMGSYDARYPSHPVESLIRAAHARGMRVQVGLHKIPDWWANPLVAASRLPAPLDTEAGKAYLKQLSRLRGFAGWYLPGEIEELTWNRPDRVPVIKAYLERASASLRRITYAPIMIAPFYGETQPTQQYAEFWRSILVNRPISILAMQDGRGARGTTPEKVKQLLLDLKPVTDAKRIELWSVTEVFRQIHGTPVDSEPFQAIPMTIDFLKAGLEAEQVSARRISFTVLNYMDPRLSPAHKQLYDDYALQCEP